MGRTGVRICEPASRNPPKELDSDLNLEKKQLESTLTPKHQKQDSSRLNGVRRMNKSDSAMNPNA